MVRERGVRDRGEEERDEDIERGREIQVLLLLSPELVISCNYM